MRMSVEGFSILASIVKSIAKESCGGKVVGVLEGGYDLKLLARSVMPFWMYSWGTNLKRNRMM